MFRAISKCLLSVSLLMLSTSTYATPKPLTDNEVKIEIIREYLTNHIRFNGPCPCPEIKAADDSRCGSRSAWSRKPETGVLCYLADVKPDMVTEWREKNATDKTINAKIKNQKEINIDNKVSEYLDKHVIGKVTHPDELNFEDLKIDDTKSDTVKKEEIKKED